MSVFDVQISSNSKSDLFQNACFVIVNTGIFE